MVQVAAEAKGKSGSPRVEGASARTGFPDIEATMPVLADLLRCDVVLYAPSDSGAVAVAEAQPRTVPSVYGESQLGRRVKRSDAPAVLQVLGTGRPARRLSRVLVNGVPAVQDIFPIKRDGSVVAAAVFEIGLIERERQRRRSPVFRRAIERLRDAALGGQLTGAGELTRLGEHDGPLVVDAKGQVIYVSSIAENLYRKLGYTQSLLGRNLAQLQTDESAYFEALERGTCVQRTGPEGPYTWTRWALPLPGDQRSAWLRRIGLGHGPLDAVLLIVRDITDEREAEQELRIRSAMIQEIHHRVKNNLQTIAALLRLQARRTGSPEADEILRQTINRILSIAVVHEFLSHDESSIIDVKQVCVRILNEVTQSILDPEKHLEFRIEGPDLPLPAQQATSCALIVNELLQNAVKHAFLGRTTGQVVVELREESERLLIRISDDGNGIDSTVERHLEGSLGLQIVRTLVRDDLKGEFLIANNETGGTNATIRFPKVARPARPLVMRGQ